ncbi:hypothetical protein AWB80_03808 [Caballeronia pedi]|uniref:Uncharacterized protein n=1 Tax=Caballeronia pedi TaxID=1777141 RepID=A0A158BMK4_9BURK|nr:hypothetical protein [Caballeronia pedi]SAK71342.1 hypothetical protein AWB80_03808 [Caballeronia pedi]
MIELLMKLGPWVVAGLSAVAALFFHLSSKAKVADAQQKAQVDVAAAEVKQQVAENNLTARKTADIQADADAAKTAATAAQERTNVENSQVILDDAAARDELIRMLRGSGEDNPGAGQGSAGADPGRR